MFAWVYIGVIATGTALSLLVVYLAALLFSKKPNRPIPPLKTARFLFHGNLLVDHNLGKPDFQTWDDFQSLLSGRFGPLPVSLEDIAGKSTVVFKELSGSAVLKIKHDEKKCLVTLCEPDGTDLIAGLQNLCNQRNQVNAQLTLSHAPCAILQINSKNGSRIENTLWKEFSQNQKSTLDAEVSALLETEASQPKLISLDRGADQIWVELFVTNFNEFHSCYATDVSELVEARNTQHTFLQTLTKTFANLSTGLCVFDRNHQLVLFNPALVNLTDLPIDFLSARPSLLNFFDKLRDLQMMHEPKNYAAWRVQVNQMIARAAGGSYDETWLLPNGLTYRVAGRPHPDGAVAFLIENITDDMVLAHQFRSQIDVQQAALDTLDDAIAIFSPAQKLLFCNSALSEMIGFDPDQNISEITAQEVLDQCKNSTAYKRGWGSIKTQLSGPPSQTPYSKIIHHKNLPNINCQILALKGNTTMLRLSFCSSLPAQTLKPETA